MSKIKVKFTEKYDKLIKSDLSTKDKLLQMLEDTIDYYTKNPKRRCVNEEGECRYNASTLGVPGSGCAIGRMLTKETRVALDNYSLLSIGGNEWDVDWGDFIRENTEVLNGFQTLHDTDYFWNETGLSEEGKTRYESLKNLINSTY